MKLFFSFLFSGVFFLNFFLMEAQENQVLVFHKTEGYHHESIPTGTATIKTLGELHNFKVTETDDASQFTEGNLKKYQLAYSSAQQEMYLTKLSKKFLKIT